VKFFKKKQQDVINMPTTDQTELTGDLNQMDQAAEAAGPAGETKEDKFRRLAKLRTNNVLNTIRILGNVSNAASYSYTPDQVEKIFAAIQSQLDKTRALFSPVEKTKPDTFDL
jgi:ABC-type Fe3+-hydroxamate transport system substrate-binding protein